MSHLLDVHEPVSPVWLGEVLSLRPALDLGEVELRRVPAADAVVRAEVTLDLEAVRRRRVPLKQRTPAQIS